MASHHLRRQGRGTRSTAPCAKPHLVEPANSGTAPHRTAPSDTAGSVVRAMPHTRMRPRQTGHSCGNEYAQAFEDIRDQRKITLRRTTLSRCVVVGPAAAAIGKNGANDRPSIVGVLLLLTPASPNNVGMVSTCARVYTRMRPVQARSVQTFSPGSVAR